MVSIFVTCEVTCTGHRCKPSVKVTVTVLPGTNLFISSFLPTRISYATEMLTTLCVCLSTFKPLNQLIAFHEITFNVVSRGQLNVIRI
jgi:hypothetical protein